MTISSNERVFGAITSAAPSNRTLSKSDFVLARSCEGKLYFRENGYADRRADDPYLAMLAEGGYMVEALAKARYPQGIQMAYGGSLAEAFNATMLHMQAPATTLFEATLLLGRRQARVDILQQTGNGVRLLEVKAKSFDGEAHRASLAAGGVGEFRSSKKPFGIASDWREKLEDVAFQVVMAEQLFPGITITPYLVLVDKSKQAGVDRVGSYFEVLRTERNGQQRLHSARYTGTPELLAQLDLLTEVDVAVEVALLRDDIRDAAARMEMLLDARFEAYDCTRSARCARCEFRLGEAPDGFSHCWGELAATSPHMLDLYSAGKVRSVDGGEIVAELFAAGKASLFDIPRERLVTTAGTVGPTAARQLRQIDHTASGIPLVTPGLRTRVEKVTYPLFFVDFEACRMALPFHAGMRPYGQVAFQWSCHVVASPGADPVHREWLNTDDVWPNAEFCRSLRATVGESGSILTWSSFEKATLEGISRELGRLGADGQELSEWILAIPARIVDLERVVKEDYYHPGMKGRTSIKVVLDSLWKSDPLMRAQCAAWMPLDLTADQDPYSSLPGIEIAGILQDVHEGTGAVRAYEAMMYGVERSDVDSHERWGQLLRQYCALDTLSMVLVFEHWRRVSGAAH